MEHHFIQANGLKFHYVEQGSGPLVLMLHGFPECWYSWRHQIEALAPHFRVVAPDLRGYNLTDKPAQGYAMPDLLSDVEALIVALGEERCHLVGHDWGGAIAWQFAAQRARRVERLAVLNCPHPALFLKGLRRPRQLLRSWYIFFFQIPRLPEWILARDDYRALLANFRGWAVYPENITDEDLEVYRAAISQPGALTAAINYYRHIWHSPAEARAALKQIKAPTLLIWGEQDIALGKELTYRTKRWAPHCTIRYIRDASHWVQQDKPELVNQLLTQFLLDTPR